VLNDDDDQCVIIETEEAGTVLRHVDPTQALPLDKDGDVVMQEDQNPFAPFMSELDWKVARCAVTDGPGHNALDRLLEIPAVSSSNHWR
jgi:hypothetical protein